MKRAAIFIAVGAFSIGLAQGMLAQETKNLGAEICVERKESDINVEQGRAEIHFELESPRDRRIYRL
ncbi:hypothetical protein SAMN04488129_10770 [Halomonas daqiaonensis]|uniref:Uncharacterized protein n=2 Tax=Halomonas daqiaonensis TaxID=650850 RepID=A0A1H7MU85_9GAMM|nr:hypothetical protein SAMN04488129_10770 [Halomonas daqiaonensis]